MKIVINEFKAFENAEDVQAFEAELAEVGSDALPLSRVIEAEKFKVGFKAVCIKANGEWEQIPRCVIEGMAVDGEPIVLHGENFVRINCIRNEEQLQKQLDIEEEHYQKALQEVNEAHQKRVERYQAELEAYLAKNAERSEEG